MLCYVMYMKPEAIRYLKHPPVMAATVYYSYRVAHKKRKMHALST